MEESVADPVEVLSPLSPCESLSDLLSIPIGSSPSPQRLSPAALAYVGDAVYELYVRAALLLPPKRSQDYHQLVVAQVRAETQAWHLQQLQPHLTHAELEILKRGRNAAPRRLKRVSPKVYQQATSLETLLGYLYLTDRARLLGLLQQLQIATPVPDSSPNA